MLILFIPIPALPQLLETTHLFTVSLVLPFLEYHIIGIIQCITLSDWLTSLSNMHLNECCILVHCLDVLLIIYPFLLKDIVVASKLWQL